MTRPRIAVLFGGACEEHAVSVKSAREVARHLDADRYEAIYVWITRDGQWRMVESPESVRTGDADGEDPEGRDHGVPATVSPDRSVHGLLVHDPAGVETVIVDVVLPVLHGAYGEDGAVQGLLELSGIPYAGCGIASSAMCMDKSLAYTAARSVGIPTPEFRILMPDEEVDAGSLAYPVFVKPARSGSSFGVSRVDAAEFLPTAIEHARAYDGKVLIERAVVGEEVGCALLDTPSGLVAGEVDRVDLSHGFFRIHQEDAPETGSENATFIVPADIPERTRDQVRRRAVAVYRALGCRGIARVDMFLTEDGEVVLNEVNTLPGLTSYSRFPRMAAAAGIPLGEVLENLIVVALAGGTR